LRSNDIILTGIPRSGTSLACKLLNKVPNCVALVEPVDVIKFAKVGSAEARCELLLAFFHHCRQSILERGEITAMTANGTMLDDTYAPEGTTSRLRGLVAERGLIHVVAPTADDFLLVVKHPNAFTALLDEFAPRFPCFATVRNPLSVLASWNSVDHPVRVGHAPVAERLNTDLAKRLSRIGSTLDRQLTLLCWYFEQYHRWLKPNEVLYYENIVHTRGRALAGIAPAAQELDEPLEDRNINRAYDRGFMMRAGEALLKTEGAYWHFYDREAISALLDTIAHSLS
jgi:hypothetical protein